jgi:hypothetical protein
MKATVILAMIPLGIAATFLPRWPDPQPAVAETFVQRFEAVYPKHTFEERWWPGEGLPLPQASPPVDLLAPKVIRTIRITKDAVEPPQEVAEVPLPRERPPPDNSDIVDRIMGNVVGSRGDLADMERAPVPRTRHRPNRVADICQRHGMHKQVTRGGKSWRCQR